MLLPSARRDNNKRKRQMEHVAQRPNSERDTVGYHFPSFKRKMEGNDGGFHACYVWRQPPPANSGRNSNRLSASKLAKRKPRQAWLDLHVGTVAATHTSRMEPAVQASRWARQAWAQGGGTDQSGRRTPSASRLHIDRDTLSVTFV